MIMKRDCLLCAFHMGPALPLPLDFLSMLPIVLEEITANPELLRAPAGGQVTAAARLRFIKFNKTAFYCYVHLCIVTQCHRLNGDSCLDQRWLSGLLCCGIDTTHLYVVNITENIRFFFYF